MNIQKLEVENFKSFKKLDISLNQLNVFIGANASGKSNFVQIFKFLKEIERNGLEDAISEEGGIDYLLNANIGITKPLKIKLTFDTNKQNNYLDDFERSGKLKNVVVSCSKFTYELTINFDEKDGFNILKDEINIELQFVKGSGSSKKTKKTETGHIKCAIKNGKIVNESHLPQGIELKDISPIYLVMSTRTSTPKGATLLGSPFFNPLKPLRHTLSISLYNFDTKACKNPATFIGKATLQENGANLSIILRKILKDEKRKTKFFNLVRDLLPFVNQIDVKTFSDKLMDLHINETYSKTFSLPAALLSDGTIGVVALIVALYFQNGSILIIEEPERYLHPFLIFKIMGMVKDVSRKKQVLITTHSPELVKYLDNLQNLFLISRETKGYSVISNPTESESVKAFLKSEIGIDELFARNLLKTHAV